MIVSTVVTVTLNTAIDRLIEVDGFHVGGHLKGRLITRVPAGKGVNVSRTLGALGVPNIATGFVGHEELDDYDRSFAGGKVQPQFLAVEGTTRENITVIDPQTRVETHIRDTGLTPTATDLDRMRNKVNLLAKPESVMVFAGSMPPGVDLEFAVELVDLAILNGAHVAVDGPGELLHALRNHKLWLLKPNMVEFATMHRLENLGEDELIPLGREVSKHVRTLIITCGSPGGYLFVDGAAFMGQVDIDPTAVKSTVGCGDAMMGAFIAAQPGWRRYQDLVPARVGGRHSSRYSPNPGPVRP